MIRRLSLFLALLAVAVGARAAEGDLLEPDQAFRLQVTAAGDASVRAEWTIADGYYLYRNKFRFESDTPGISLGEPVFPKGKVKNDEFFGKMEIYRHRVAVEIPVKREAAAPDTLKLTATSQGCADIGVCYPPSHQTVELTLPAPVLSVASTKAAGGSKGLGLEDEQEALLDPDQAFRLETKVLDGNTLLARVDIAPGYYLYRNKFSFRLKDGQGVSLGPVQLPKGQEKNDEFFGRLEVFHDSVEARLPLVRTDIAPRDVTLEVGYQGCAELGVCYPPIKKTVTLSLPAGTTGGEASAPAAPPPAAADAAPATEQDQLAQLIKGGNLWAIVAAFFVAGLGLSLTPCVFPMIPILSGIIVGQGERLTTRHAFSLSAVYVLAMALTYTVAGIIAGLFGTNLQAAFQNPWILSAFALIFVALAFSMFGFYDIQMPSFLQSRLTEISNRQRGGTLAGVAVMGFLSALIVGPCVAAPLLAALIVIGQTGDPALGGLALFALSLGMGTPLLAIGTSAGRLLPKAGGWMEAIKAVFGVLMLAVAIWMLERILPAVVTMVLWALLLLVSAVYMGALEPVREGAGGWRKLWKGLGLALLIHGALLLVGAAAGSGDPLQPLRGLSLGGGTTQSTHLEFKSIKTLEDLQREVKAASAQGRAVMVDFYADWCVSCKEFEKYTFTDPGVQQALGNALLLQADVTANDAADKALMRHFNIIGPPAILFFGADGKERNNLRVVGFMEADAFRAHLRRALGS